MAMIRNCLFLCLFFLFSFVTAQQSAPEMWELAQDAYLKENYSSAAESFTKYLDMQPGSYVAMYNLGNCYLRMGDIGRSVLWYERAKKLRPHDSEILHNLEIARARRLDPVVEIQGFFLMRWLHWVSNLMSVCAWGIVSLLFFLVAVVFTALGIRQGVFGRRRWIVLVSSACFAFAVLFGANRYHELHQQRFAVVLEQNIPVYIAPDSESKLVAKIGAGEKVEILDTLDDFVKIRMANFEMGWVQQQTVERI